MNKMKNPKKRIKPAVWQDIVPAKQVKKKPQRFLKLQALFKPVKKSRFYLESKKQISKLDKKILIRKTIRYGIFIIIISAFYFMATRPQVNTQDPKIVETGLVKGTPEYSTLLPKDKTIVDLGGWTRVSAPASDPVFAYTDKIGNSPIIVSQQPLPDDLKENTEDEVDQLAQGFRAREKITIGNITVHIGTSAKGPQSVIFAKDGLLILIKSTVQISNDEWAQYINSLQ